MRHKLKAKKVSLSTLVLRRHDTCGAECVLKQWKKDREENQGHKNKAMVFLNAENVESQNLCLNICGESEHLYYFRERTDSVL